MRPVLAAALLPTGALLAQSPAVSLDHEAKHHLVLANQWVRVFDVVVPPGDSTLYHVHPNDYTYVTFGAVPLKAQALGSAATDLSLGDGEVRYTRGPITHRVLNPSSVPFHNLTIELLGKSGVPLPPPAGGTVILDNDRVRAVRVVLDPGQSTTAQQRVGPRLDVAVSPGVLRVVDATGGNRSVTYRTGDFRWNTAARTETWTNVGKTRVEMVEFDWK